MSQDATVSFSLEVNVEKAYEDVRRLQTILFRTAGIIQKMSGDENLDLLMSKIQQTIAMLNQLRLTLAAVQAARMAAGDPLAWAMAGVAVVGVGVDIVTSMRTR